MDVLSDVLSAVRLKGALFFDIDSSPPWVGESPSTADIATIMPDVQHIISFHAVLSGSCWAALADRSVPPELLQAGDVVIFPGGAPNTLSSTRGERGEPEIGMYYRPIRQHLPFRLILGGDGEPRTRFVCGYLGCDARPFNPLLAALPPILTARKPADGRVWVTDYFQLALLEGSSGRAGGEAVLAKLSELMFVEVLRLYIEALPSEARGWLSGLRDSHIGEALRLIHATPAEPWTLESLARKVGLSRSAFANRFTQLVEISAMQYLLQWRLQIAARMLDESRISIAQVAAEIGYGSEAAFHRAFKSYVGTPPGAWRRGKRLAMLHRAERSM